MRDSLGLIDIYKKYLEATAELITITEHYQENQEFLNGVHSLIENLNDDLHTLLKIVWAVKKLES